MPEASADVVAATTLLVLLSATSVQPAGNVIEVVDAMREEMTATNKSPSTVPAGNVSVCPVAVTVTTVDTPTNDHAI